MRLLFSLLCLACGLGFRALAGDSQIPAVASDAPAAAGLVVGISPFLDPASKDIVYRGLVRLIVEDLPLGSSLDIFDAYNLKSITRVSIPDAKVFQSAKTRANQFAGSIGEIKKFLAAENAKPSGPKPGFDGAIRLPQFSEFLARNRPARREAINFPLLLVGSPLYQDAKEPAFSMAEGYFPSDGHLRASREQSVFGFNPGESPATGPFVYWAFFGDPWLSDLHREKVERFWALYLERRGGRLASFSPDFLTAVGAFASSTPGPTAASKGWAADPLQTRPEMLSLSRSVEKVDWLTGNAPSESSPPPSKLVGPIKIGIRWKENIDLDLYAAPRRDAETLFFNHTRSPEGYYFKDHRSSPGHEYEFIEFESPIDVRKMLAYVNFYDGVCPGGPRGEVRIEFLDRIYTGTFEIASPEGNQGRQGRGQADYWARIPVLEILRLKDSESRAASLPR